MWRVLNKAYPRWRGTLFFSRSAVQHGCSQAIKKDTLGTYKYRIEKLVQGRGLSLGSRQRAFKSKRALPVGSTLFVSLWAKGEKQD
jgi:hypothetical protein